MAVWLVVATVLVVNVPFGYWRGNVRRLSLQWLLAIHLPVFLAIVLRLAAQIPLEPSSIALMMLAFFLGQTMGQLARHPLRGLVPASPSSCLVWDLVRLLVY